MRVTSIMSRSLESGCTWTTNVTTSGASVSPSFFAERSATTSGLARGESVNACVDGEMVEMEGRIAAKEPRLEVGAEEMVDASCPTLPALIVQHRSVPNPRTRRSSATSRSALRSAFICDDDAGGAVWRRTWAKATAGAYAREPVRKARTSDATASSEFNDEVGTTSDARKRTAQVPAMESVKGFDRKTLSLTRGWARYHGGRNRGPVAVVRTMIHDRLTVYEPGVVGEDRPREESRHRGEKEEELREGPGISTDQHQTRHSPLVSRPVLVAVAVPRRGSMVVRTGAEDNLLDGLLGDVHCRKD